MRKSLIQLSTIASIVLASLSMTACDDDSNDNSTTPGNTPSTSVTDTCTAGENRCANGDLYVCENNSWNMSKKCENGCSADGKTCATAPADNGNNGSGTGNGDNGSGTGNGDNGSGSGNGDNGSGSGNGDNGSGTGNGDNGSGTGNGDNGSGTGNGDNGSGTGNGDNGSGTGNGDNGSGTGNGDNGSGTGNGDNGSGTGNGDNGSGTGNGDNGSGTGNGDNGSGTGNGDNGSGTENSDNESCDIETFKPACENGKYTVCAPNTNGKGVKTTTDCNDKMACVTINENQTCAMKLDGIPEAEKIQEGEIIGFDCNTYLETADEDGLYFMVYLQAEKAKDGKLYGVTKIADSVCNDNFLMYCDKEMGEEADYLNFDPCGKGCTDTSTVIAGIDFVYGECTVPKDNELCSSDWIALCKENYNDVDTCYVENVSGTAVCTLTCSSSENDDLKCDEKWKYGETCTEIAGTKLMTYTEEECSNQCVADEAAKTAVCK